MKRFVLLTLVMMMSLSSFAQVSSGSWNSSTATYTNSKHGISWQLIEEWSWVGRPILAESTLLKVRNDDTHILVSLGAEMFDGQDEDAWSMMSYYDSKEYMDLAKAKAKMNDMTLKSVKAVKSQICGIHANKVKNDLTKYYSEYDVTVHSVEYTYQFCKKNYIYTLTITALSCLEEELSDFDKIVTLIINGFSII